MLWESFGLASGFEIPFLGPLFDNKIGSSNPVAPIKLQLHRNHVVVKLICADGEWSMVITRVVDVVKTMGFRANYFGPFHIHLARKGR